MQNLNPKNCNYFKLIFFLLVFFITVQIRAQFPFYESFKNNTAPNIQFGGSPTAFLTGGAGLKSGYNDSDGNGFLRLTNNGTEQRGMVWSDLYAFPSVYGMTISFEYYTHTGSDSNGADGICFVLFDAAVTSVTNGAFGGSLGYAQQNLNSGFSGGYLGIGIDEYGNYAANTEGKSGGTLGITSNSIVLRGQGSGTTGYPYLTSTQTTASPYSFYIPGKDRTATDNSKAGFRKVEIVLKPRVAGGFFIDVYLEHGNTKSLVINNYEYTTAPPPMVKFAITSSTGGDNNFHEIRNLNLSVDLPTLLVPEAKTNSLSGCAGLASTTSNDINDTNNGRVNTLATINRQAIDLDLDIPGIQSSKTVPGKGTFTYDSVTGKVTFTPINNSVEESVQINYTFNDTYGKTSNVSTITYTPIVNRPTDIVTSKKICSGDTYIWSANNQPYTSAQTGLKIINDGCTANQILNLEVLARPNIPTITTTTASCSVASTSKIDNYSPADNTYTFDPTGPEIDAQGFINNITPKIQYNVTAVSKTTNCASSPTSLTKDAFDDSGCYPVLNTTVTSLTKSICNSINETVSYEIKITNSGVQTAEAVKLDFIFPNGIIFDYSNASYTNGSSGPTGSIPLINTASNPLIGNFTIPSNGTVIILLKGKTTNTAITGTFSVDSQVTYLDPTRTIGNPNGRITPFTNSYSGVRTYESGGNVPGSNFDGRSTTADDVIIKPKPATITTIQNICFGESFTWAVDGKTYSVSGIYTQINDGCTADQTLELNIGTKPNTVITKENICFGESFTWAVDRKTYSVSGIYTQSNDGCTADQTLELNIGTKPATVITKENICFGESFTWAVDGKTYSVSGIYTQSNDGCTADQTLELNIGTKPATVITKENICFGESFTWAVDGKTYSVSGIYTQSNDGCTADQTLELNIGTKPNTVITKENICFGESFTWAVDGKTYSASGIYSQINDGCTADQTLELNIETKPATVITKENICSGESFTWAVDGKTYSVSGIYTQINDGCTADQTLELNIGTKPNAVITKENICSGESFTWAVDGKTYSVSGIYTQSNDGCTADQTLELNIGTKPNAVITKENICFGESFTWAVDGKTYSVSGIYTQINDGCTADQTLELNIGTKPNTLITKENICFGESFTWAVDAKTYSVSGIYTQSNDGCTADQTLELNIGTKPDTVITKENICFGESFTWAVDGKTYSVSGIYTQSNDGCTADQTLELNINQALNAFLVPNSTIPESCPGENNASFDIEITGGIMPYSINLDNKITPFTPVTNSEYTFMNLVGGSHTVYIKDALDCISELDVFIPKGITINPIANVTYSCLNDLPSNSVTIKVDPSITDLQDLDYSLDGINYQADNTFVNVAAGTHTIKARHTNGCIQQTQEFVIDNIEPLTLKLVDGELNEIVATTTGGNGQYRYSFNNESFSTANKFIIYKSGMYTVTVTDQNGCSATSSRYFDYVDVCISNYFTPNGDGVNDEWGPDCTVNYKNLTYTIFDRYGRTIATYKLGQKWDGKYNGAELTSGDYWYVLKLNDPKDNREFVGHFTLYR